MLAELESPVAEGSLPVVILKPFDLIKEKPVSIKDTAEYLGKTKETIKRWMLEGVKRKGAPRPKMQTRVIQLQACYLGESLVTSMESIVRFSDRLSQTYAMEDLVDGERTVPIKRASHDAAASQLKALGY